LRWRISSDQKIQSLRMPTRLRREGSLLDEFELFIHSLYLELSMIDFKIYAQSTSDEDLPVIIQIHQCTIPNITMLEVLYAYEANEIIFGMTYNGKP
jgi:hypothetical protein